VAFTSDFIGEIVSSRSFSTDKYVFSIDFIGVDVIDLKYPWSEMTRDGYFLLKHLVQ
jgi:hypothetical protein